MKTHSRLVIGLNKTTILKIGDDIYIRAYKTEERGRTRVMVQVPLAIKVERISEIPEHLADTEDPFTPAKIVGHQDLEKS